MNQARRKALNAIYKRMNDLNGLLSNVKYLADEIREELREVCESEEESHGNLPESLQDGERGLAMREAIELMERAAGDLEDVANVCDLDEAMEAIDDAQAAGQ